MTNIFRRILVFKLFMVLVPWGLGLVFLAPFLPHILGMEVSSFNFLLLRIIGLVVLVFFPLYFYIYKKPETRAARFLMLGAVLDNGILGTLLLWLSWRYQLSWVAIVNAFILLFFSYWFFRFYREAKK